MGATGRPDLHERELPAIHRVPLQEPLNGLKTFRYPLGVVHPVHAHSHQQGLHAQLAQQVRPVYIDGFVGRVGLRGLGYIHADGKGTDRGAVVTALDGKMFPVHSRFQGAVHRFHEVVAVGLDMKTNEVRTQ